ncbi:uridine kinase [Nostocoides sp. F2B08]|uniref:ATP/GTP-binding protein n=1 Tax=Nostocoides sp. F2B08 TaxID=2653936 RepID=UPI0012635124|nr:ATP/GTP-binding protein [Tetrasphaera sp. F2B08]KAB7745349.1 uridine kinase [Tetrasphaera sp. F2B08]
MRRAPDPNISPVEAVVAATPVPGRPAKVGVDGVDGSGKTTFAGELATAYRRSGREVHVVHLDDFLNPRAVRHRVGRSSPEGFVRDSYDLAAVRAAVLAPLGTGREHVIVPRVFDHVADRPVRAEPVTVGRDAVVVVEGLFLHRPELRESWDVSVFLDVPFEVSAARLAARDGSPGDPEHPAMRRYVEGQRIYLRECRPQERATFVLTERENGTGWGRTKG